MAPEPWTITKRKRHVSTPATEGSSRQKRARLSVASSSDGQGRQRQQQHKQKQQTLTQAQWIPSRTPSFQDEPDLEPLKVRARSVGTPNKATTRNRNSTLTQMDFFRDIHVREGEDKLDDRPLDEAEATAANFASLDGDVDSHPTKPRSRSRSRSRSPVKSAVNSNPGTNKMPQRDNVSQAVYEPSKMRRKQASSRVADREARHNKNDTPLADTDPSKNRFGGDSHAVSGRDRVLEIQESIETDEEDDVQALSPPPHYTPARVILSSQSPERAPCLSLVTKSRGGGRRRTTRKAALVAEERGDTRSPLREKSVNLPPSQLAATRKTCDKPPKPSIPRSQRQRKASPTKPKPSKIVSLKLPKRSGGRRLKVEDSQAPLWSLPESSSSLASSELGNESNALQDHYSGPLPPAAEADKRGESNEEVEIPATSQVEAVEVCPADVGSATVTASEADERVEPDQSLPPATNVDGEQSTGEEIMVPSPKTPPRRAAAAAAAAAAGENEEGSDLDFDSPIANDTQFNAEVARRLTTTPPSSLPLLPPDTISDDLFAIPTPRLVHSSSRPGRSQVNNKSQQQQQEQESDQQTCSEDISLPPAPQTQTQTQTRTTTTLVPLNDTLMPPPRQHPASSSSPPASASASALPQSHSSTLRSTATTQMSLAALPDVRPASLPHSSQISTQEATQFAFMSSLVPTAAEFPGSSAAVNKEQITIKEDSSSIGMLLPLSQIPRVKREESQIVEGNQDEDKDGDDDDDDEEEEVDLDERLNRQHQYHEQSGRDVAEAAAAEAADDGDSPRTRIKQESQLDQSTVAVGQGNDGADAAESQRLPSSSPSPSPSSSPPNRSHSPIPGFDNETQSNFTQGGHVTAAYIHRQRELGLLPKWYTPKPFRVPGYTRR